MSATHRDLHGGRFHPLLLGSLSHCSLGVTFTRTGDRGGRATRQGLALQDVELGPGMFPAGRFLTEGRGGFLRNSKGERGSAVRLPLHRVLPARSHHERHRNVSRLHREVHAGLFHPPLGNSLRRHRHSIM